MQKPFRGAFKLALSSLLLISCSSTAVFADQYYDAGLKFFKNKKFSEAAQYFEASIKNAPWESNAFYYCGLTYHYMGKFKQAAEKYAECVERFPGTEAGNQAQAALKVVDPKYEERKKAEREASASRIAAATNQSASGAQKGSSGSAADDKGTIEGQAQTRVFYKMNDRDKVVKVYVNGRQGVAIFDQHGATQFSRDQLKYMGVPVPSSSTEIKAEISIGGITRKNFPLTVVDNTTAARIGSSFLDDFDVNVSETGKTIDLKRKGASGQNGPSIAFTREKDSKVLSVSVELNGKSTPMLFDPEGGSPELQITTQLATSLGLKLDDAVAERKSPAELPLRGTPGWVSPEDRGNPDRFLGVRMKLGPIENPRVLCRISEKGPKKPTFGPDFFSKGGYKFDIDYKSNKIYLTRK